MTFMVSSLPHFQHYTGETVQIEPFRTSAVDCINNWVEYCFSYRDWANLVIFLSFSFSILIPASQIPSSQVLKNDLENKTSPNDEFSTLCHFAWIVCDVRRYFY